MTDEQRTATDVLLAVEKQIAQLVYMHRSLDLNIKVLSNKVNTVIGGLDHITNLINEVPGEFDHGFTMDTSLNPHTIATAPPSRIQVEEEFAPAIPMTKETAPVGIRRTARGSEPLQPKTQGQKPIAKNVPTPSFPVPEMKPSTQVAEPTPATGKVPLSQRVVDRNSNSIFKADVEITNEAGSTVWKGQTGTTGKWTTALDPGKYRISVRKQTTQQKFQAAQDLIVNTRTPNELPIMLIK